VAQRDDGHIKAQHDASSFVIFFGVNVEQRLVAIRSDSALAARATADSADSADSDKVAALHPPTVG